MSNFISLEESLLEIGEWGKTSQAMKMLRKENPKLYLNVGSRIKKRLDQIYMEQQMGNRKTYDIGGFYFTKSEMEQLQEYLRRKKSDENPTLNIVGGSGVG